MQPTGFPGPGDQGEKGSRPSTGAGHGEIRKDQSRARRCRARSGGHRAGEMGLKPWGQP